MPRRAPGFSKSRGAARSPPALAAKEVGPEKDRRWWMPPDAVVAAVDDGGGVFRWILSSGREDPEPRS